jgi:hypothetical protein
VLQQTSIRASANLNPCFNVAALYQGTTSVVPQGLQELIWALAPASLDSTKTIRVELPEAKVGLNQ